MTTPKEAADTIHATLRAKPGCEDQLETRLAELLEKTSHEDAVRIYAIHRDVDTDADFIVYERYVDSAGMQLHLASEHLRQALTACEPLLAGPPNMTQSRARFGLPYRRTDVDGVSVDVYVIPIGPVALTFARAEHGLVTCGAILPSALESFEIAAARVRPRSGAIGSLDDLLVAKVVDLNQPASTLGVTIDMTGREALSRLGQRV
jgi:quinol monooxygenase YgiN/uncharacterized protein YunC (DUF1805 family)